MISMIEGGITAPRGFSAAGVSCGLKKDGKKDLAIVSSNDIAVCAGVFTSNKVKGHSLKLTMDNIQSGYAKAVVVHSGIANALLGEAGDGDAKEITTLSASLMDCDASEILIASTGIIGLPLNMPSVRKGIRNALACLSDTGGHDAAQAILTTDTCTKEYAIEIEIQDEKIRLGGMAKGSSSVHPNMATTLCLITTDVNISKSLLQKALNEAVNKSFNHISIDSETSICDMVLMFANGEAENSGIVKETYDYHHFVEALTELCTNLAKSIVKDGLGATKFVEVQVEHAVTKEDAKAACESIARSMLFKKAIHREEVALGSLVTALGNSNVDFEPNLFDISICNIPVCKNATAVAFDAAVIKDALRSSEIKVTINLKKGFASYQLWTCDMPG